MKDDGATVAEKNEANCRCGKYVKEAKARRIGDEQQAAEKGR